MRLLRPLTQGPWVILFLDEIGQIGTFGIIYIGQFVLWCIEDYLQINIFILCLIVILK